MQQKRKVSFANSLNNQETNSAENQENIQNNFPSLSKVNKSQGTPVTRSPRKLQSQPRLPPKIIPNVNPENYQQTPTNFSRNNSNLLELSQMFEQIQSANASKGK